MEQDDVIEVYQEQTGGVGRYWVWWGVDRPVLRLSGSRIFVNFHVTVTCTFQYNKISNLL
jgi:hypothetical protein